MCIRDSILGYRRVNGTYVPEPEQAETVRLIFQMYSSGEVGLQKIVAELSLIHICFNQTVSHRLFVNVHHRNTSVVIVIVLRIQ